MIRGGKTSFTHTKTFSVTLPPKGYGTTLFLPKYCFVRQEMLEKMLPDYFGPNNKASGLLFRWHYTFFSDSDKITTFSSDYLLTNQEVVDNMAMRGGRIPIDLEDQAKFTFTLLDDNTLLISQDIKDSKLVFIHSSTRKNRRIRCQIQITQGLYFEDPANNKIYTYDSGYRFLDWGPLYLYDKAFYVETGRAGPCDQQVEPTTL